MSFTKEELEEMRRADEEIEREFRLTEAERKRSMEFDRDAVLDSLPRDKQKVAEYKRAYYEANREKVAEYQRAYRARKRSQAAAQTI